MRIIIATVQVPFVWGGAEFHARSLRDELIRAGHEAETVTMPFKSTRPSELLSSMFAWRNLDLSEIDGVQTDLLIALRFPAYYVRHKNKVVWLLHQHRDAYDLYDKRPGGLADTKEGIRTRELIIKNDCRFLNEAGVLYANSGNVAERLQRYNGIVAPPLYHPPPDYGSLCPGPPGDYVFYLGRLDYIKRQHLLIEAMSYTRTPVKAVIGGRGSREYTEHLKSLIKRRNLGDKVLLTGPCSDTERIDLYSRCLCVFFGGYDEDYGYGTLEAFFSAKPVLALSDSGGALEFVTDEQNGFILPTDNVHAIASALDMLYKDKDKASTLGMNGLGLMKDMNINWDRVIETLLGTKQGKDDS